MGNTKTALSSRFVKNILPSILSSIVLGTFSIVDGLFIGNKVGDAGLAAINFAYPITAFVQAIGFGIGMGGAVCVSLAAGRGDRAGIRRYVFHTCFALAAASLFWMPLLFFATDRLLVWFGAAGETFAMAKEYAVIILAGTIFQIFGQGLVPLVRNFGYNAYTMAAMSGGFLVNLILDYVFIYRLNLSLAGTAWGTFAAQTFTALLCVAILCKKKYRPHPCIAMREIGEVCLIALSPFGIFFSPNLVLILINKAASLYGGDVAVAAYTAVTYVTFIGMRLIQGICDGAQPLFSFFEGAQNGAAKRKILGYCWWTVLGAGAALTAACIGLRSPFSGLFGMSADAIEIFGECMVYLAAPFVAFGCMRVCMSYFYALKKNALAFVLVYGEPLITAIVVFTFPLHYGLVGIWLSAPVSQVVLAILGCAFLLAVLRREARRRSSASPIWR